MRLPSGGETIRASGELMHRSTGVEVPRARCASATRFANAFYLSIHLVPSRCSTPPRRCEIPWERSRRPPPGRFDRRLISGVGVYMGSVCAHRFVAGRDHRAVYYAAGLAAASSLFIEKNRGGRSCALSHARAIDSLVSTMSGKRLLPAVPHAELLLLRRLRGVDAPLRERTRTLASFLRSTIRRFVRHCRALPNSASEAMSRC